MDSDPLRHHHHHRKRLIGPRKADRLVEFVAEGIGTVQFLAVALMLIVAWIVVNGGYSYIAGAIGHLEHGQPFDAAPWVLLNLIFSFEAFFTGSLVVIAAKAQAHRDRSREEADAAHREELAAAQVQLLQQNMALVRQIHALATQVHGLLTSR